VSELISFGAGVNSTAMTILLVNEGWRGPIMFADTGCEWPETYCFAEMFARDWLAPRAMRITVLDGAYRAQASGRDERTLIGYCEGYAVTPFAGSRWCTQGWKSEPMRHWADAQGITEQLVGIAADEAHRQRELRYPLVERGITRADCIRIIEAEGLPVPQKSGCYICPFQRIGQWRDLYYRHPELFERAARLEELSSARRGVQAHIRVGGEMTLRQMQARFERQTALFDEGEWDSLLRYKPCVCGV